MEQQALSSGVNFRNGQTLGSLQHAPQFTHWPLRLSETGNTAVKVLFILASQVFLLSKSHPTKKMTYAQLAKNNTPAAIQAAERSVLVRLMHTRRAQITRTAIAAENKVSAEYSRGLYNQA